MTDEFTQTITFRPAFDRRDPNPSKNYGIHGVEIRWVLNGPKGATQFLLFTNWHLPHVEEEHERDLPRDKIDYRIRRPLPADLGYHADEPRYEGQDEGECDLRPSGRCYYDGSGLNAERIYRVLVEEGGEAVWRELREYYDEIFAVAAGSNRDQRPEET